jgi:four helix bundle protein
MATGSASELEYHILLAHDLNVLDEAAYKSLDDKVVEVKKMLGSLNCKVDLDQLKC